MRPERDRDGRTPRFRQHAPFMRRKPPSCGLVGWIISAPLHFRCEPPAHGVFGHDPREQKILQVVGAAGLGAAAGHLVTAERMPGDESPGDRPVDVKVATSISAVARWMLAGL